MISGWWLKSSADSTSQTRKYNHEAVNKLKMPNFKAPKPKKDYF